MLEGLKELLGMLEHVADLGLWVLVGYIVYMLVIYLSTNGSIVFCIKLLIDSIREARKRSIDTKAEIEREKLQNERRPTEWKIGNTILGDSAQERHKTLLATVCAHRHSDTSLYRSQYLHDSDISWLVQAVNAQIEKDKAA